MRPLHDRYGITPRLGDKNFPHNTYFATIARMRKETSRRFRQAILSIATVVVLPYMLNPEHTSRVDKALWGGDGGCPPAKLSEPIDALVVLDAGTQHTNPNPMTRTAIEDAAFSYVQQRYIGQAPRNIHFLNGLDVDINRRTMSLASRIINYYSHGQIKTPPSLFSFSNEPNTTDSVIAFTKIAEKNDIDNIVLAAGPNRKRAAIELCERGFTVTVINPVELRKKHNLTWGERISGRAYRGDPIKQRIIEFFKLAAFRFAP